MIPYQPLTDRRGESLGFFAWAAPHELPKSAGHEPYPETKAQLIGWVHALFANYGLNLSQPLEIFNIQCTEAGALEIRLPKAYFRCADKPFYLQFDPVAWLAATGIREVKPCPNPQTRSSRRSSWPFSSWLAKRFGKSGKSLKPSVLRHPP